MTNFGNCGTVCDKVLKNATKMSFIYPQLLRKYLKIKKTIYDQSLYYFDGLEEQFINIKIIQIIVNFVHPDWLRLKTVK